ncbi:hypothetical protein U9M48_043995 [Paspalum notatum var. saurae]|uniref:Protein kinase domain-containing protein n=1 Tax=Paspalum notatum var. saurae TaxID=547442 RepID=A0AAQ3UYM3_PASNO
MSITEYVGKMKSFADEMACAGKPLEDEELVQYILAGLDMDYNPIVSLQVQGPAVPDQELLRQARRRRLRLRVPGPAPRRHRRRRQETGGALPRGGEVSTLGTIQHVNQIRLLGFCSEGGDRRKLLVYEYMPNGSLDRHLFGARLYTLSWRARYRIAVGVAKGLAYLHDECRDRIIHCDVMPENILLDADFAPKVADFGLAKLVGTRQGLQPGPDHHARDHRWIGGEAITAKADVFSYGMMLFEIVSGRRNVGHGRSESEPDSSIVARRGRRPSCVRMAGVDGDVKALLDPELGDDANVEEVRTQGRLLVHPARRWRAADDGGGGASAGGAHGLRDATGAEVHQTEYIQFARN